VNRSWARFKITLLLKDRDCCKIRVNTISPGPIDTPGLSAGFSGLGQSEDQIKTGLVASIPLGRMGNPDEVAKAVLFLATNDSSFVTGIELFVDGGAAQI
jgi:NAD(P)-dependent dehydrogenase (short-subunit alcohol dehydrogenase family)